MKRNNYILLTITVSIFVLAGLSLYADIGLVPISAQTALSPVQVSAKTSVSAAPASVESISTTPVSVSSVSSEESVKNLAVNLEKVLAAFGSFVSDFTTVQQKIAADATNIAQSRTAHTSLIANFPSVVATAKEGLSFIEKLVTYFNDQMTKGTPPASKEQLAIYSGYLTVMGAGLKDIALVLEKVVNDAAPLWSSFPPIHQKIIADVTEINQAITANLSFMVRLKAVIVLVKDLTSVVDIAMAFARIVHEQILKPLDPSLAESLAIYYGYWDTFHKTVKLVVVGLEKVVSEAMDPIAQLQQKFVTDIAALQGAKTGGTASSLIRLPLLKDVAEAIDLAVRLAKSLNEQSFREAMPSVYQQITGYIHYVEAFNADIKTMITSLEQIFSALK
ncbi:MAG: hypothetical protein NTX86_04955 [Candidatus Dependentiae bacterium]|nr:hypothetical protein [Candidatus Dependentiae bacterium]